MNHAVILLLSAAMMSLQGCAGQGGSQAAAPASGPDIVLAVAAPLRYDGYTYDRSIYQRFYIKNIGDALPSGTIVNVHFAYLRNGVVDSEYDFAFISDLMVGESYDFTLAKGFPDADFDPSEWSVESTVDPSNRVAERSERNNHRIDPFRTYPDDPGVPDDGSGIDDLYLVNDNANAVPPIYGASTARVRIICRGPLVPINAAVRVRATRYSGGVAQEVLEGLMGNAYYEMQYGGLTIAFPFAFELPADDFLRIEVDPDDAYDEDDESNNVIDVPFVYDPGVAADA